MEAELGKNEPSPEILAILCIGFSKFLLLGVVDDPKVPFSFLRISKNVSETPLDASMSSCCICISGHGRQSRSSTVPLLLFHAVQYCSSTE